MKMTIAIMLLFTLLIFPAYAGDFHDDGEAHLLIYVIKDTSGNHVSGQTVRLSVRSSDNVHYYDFTNNIWANFSSTVSHKTLSEDALGGFYYFPLTIDSAIAQSGDFVFIVSNDNATYADLQAESVNFSNIKNLIKIYR